MDELRARYLDLAKKIREVVPEGRQRALALTHLEDSLIRAATAMENPNTIL